MLARLFYDIHAGSVAKNGGVFEPLRRASLAQGHSTRF